VRFSRSILAAITALAVCLVVAAPASAVLRVDRSFGANGVVKPQAGDPEIDSILQMALGPRGGIYLLACDGSCSQGTKVVRLRRDGGRDLSYGSGLGAVPLGSAQETRITVDSSGRLVAALTTGGTIVVQRFDANGAPDLNFAGDGAVEIECGCDGESILEPAGPGQILVGRENSLDVYPPGEGTVNRIEFHLWRLREGGGFDLSYGVGGANLVNIDRAYGGSMFSKVSFTRASGQTLLAGLNDTQGIFVHRLAKNGKDDLAGFAARTQRALAGLRSPQGQIPSFVTSIIPRAKGGFDVLGNTDGFSGFILRFRQSGHLDRRFGNNGLELLPYVLRSAALGNRGRVFAVGSGQGADGSLVFWLRRDGTIERAGGRPRVLRLSAWDPSQSTAGVQRGVRPVVFNKGYDFCRYVCTAHPKLIRFAG